MSDPVLWRGDAVFDGDKLRKGHAVLVHDGAVMAIGPETSLLGQGDLRDAGDRVLTPGFVDLQVNGGGGLMLGEVRSTEDVAKIAHAHRGLGTGALLPTLISDTRETTQAVVNTVAEAIAQGVRGIAGLHLEGPHLATARAGAHDLRHLRPMTQDDRDAILSARKRLPALMVTLAPEQASPEDVTVLAEAGVFVSLGHTDADYATAQRFFAAGALGVTHLFNAMPALLHRAPGLVGAALENEDVLIGLIADGVHVQGAVLGAALRAARGNICLVSDAMAVAGTNASEFKLGGRTIRRSEGRLTLNDGTLAGADLTLGQAIGVAMQSAGLPLEAALLMATTIPARSAGLPVDAGRLVPGSRCLNAFDPQTGTTEPLLF